MLKANKKSLEVVFAGFFDLAAFNVDEVECDLALPLQFVEIKAKRAHVFGQLGSAFLKHHENAGLAVLHRAANEKLGR